MMKKYLMLTMLVITMSLVVNGAIIYVKPLPGTSDDGLTWATAYIGGDGLKSAITNSLSGDEIWVMAGTYLPSSTNDRTLAFTLKTGVSVYGGFLGTETLLTQRNWVTNVTTLSGDIGVLGDNADNSNNVVRNLDVATDAGTLDGFTVSGGNGIGAVAPGQANGGGLHIKVSNTINNCIIENNNGVTGGAFWINNSTAITVVMNNCIVRSNTATTQYAGIVAFARVTLTMEKCTISANTAPQGGGIGVSAGSAPITCTMTDCKILNNTATGPGGGGGLHVVTGAAGLPIINLTNCEISGNTCTNATGTGGGISMSAGATTLMPAATFTNCLITGNKAFKGGGISLVAALGNTATANYTFINCTIANNLADGMGSSGGGINFSPISATTTLTLSNSIVWGNTTSDGTLGQQIFRLGGVDPVINKCCISNSANDNDGIIIPGTSLTTDPLFVSASDFRLQSSSPAIDFGDNSLNSTATDIRGAGFARIVGTIDLGAYEYFLTSKADFARLANTSIYPTVTEGIIKIVSAVKLKSIQLYSITGKAIKQWPETNLIDISDLAKGTYLLKLSNYEGSVATYKVFKQ